MPEMIAVDHAVSWTEWDERTRSYQHHSVKRGESADIPDEVLARLEKTADREAADQRAGRLVGRDAGHPRVLAADEFEAWTNVEAFKADPVYQLSDDELMALPAEALLAQLNSTPGLAERVLPLEQARKYTRKAIVTHCERLMAAEVGDDVSLGDADDVTPLLSPNA